MPVWQVEELREALAHERALRQAAEATANDLRSEIADESISRAEISGRVAGVGAHAGEFVRGSCVAGAAGGAEAATPPRCEYACSRDRDLPSRERELGTMVTPPRSSAGASSQSPGAGSVPPRLSPPPSDGSSARRLAAFGGGDAPSSCGGSHSGGYNESFAGSAALSEGRDGYPSCFASLGVQLPPSPDTSARGGGAAGFGGQAAAGPAATSAAGSTGGVWRGAVEGSSVERSTYDSCSAYGR